jgi:hypothetical protein
MHLKRAIYIQPKNSPTRVEFKYLQVLFFLILFSLLCTSCAFAQNTFIIRGRLINADTKDPVSAASIFIRKAGIGVISNDIGEYVFHIPYENRLDTVCISSLGYKNYYIVLGSDNNNDNLTIKLKPSAYMLDPIIVKSKNKRGTAERLIKKAIENIDTNYPQQGYQISGYYRDYLEKHHQYFNLLEAALEVEDKGFSTDDAKTSRIRIVQMRYNPSYLYDSSQIMLYDNRRMKYIPGAYINPMDGNEFLILRSHDALRNNNRFTLSFLDYFSKNFVHNHNFKIDSITYINDIQVYSISFKYNNRYGYDSAANFSANGYLLLRKDNFALYRITYNTYIFDKDYDGRLYNLVIEYREMEGRYYPQYLSFGNYFKIRNRVDTSTFKMQQTIFRKSSKVLELHFNRNVDTISGHDTSNYSIHYGMNKIPVGAIGIYKNVVRILLKIDANKLKELTDEGDLIISIGEISDIQGNRMAGKYNGYYQHRDFFVNKITPHISQEFPYSDVIPKTMPLYWNRSKNDPEFWNSYNAVYDLKLK